MRISPSNMRVIKIELSCTTFLSALSFLAHLRIHA